MTIRRITFQLTPLFDLMLIVLFAMHMEIPVLIEEAREEAMAMVRAERSKREEAERKLAEAERLWEEAQEMVATLREEVGALRREVTALSGALVIERLHREEAEQQRDEARQLVEALRGEVEALEVALATERQRLEEAERRLEAKLAAIANLHDEMDALEGALAVERDTLHLTEQHLDEALATVLSLRDEMAAKAERIAALRAEADRLGHLLAQAKATIRRAAEERPIEVDTFTPEPGLLARLAAMQNPFRLATYSLSQDDGLEAADGESPHAPPHAPDDFPEEAEGPVPPPRPEAPKAVAAALALDGPTTVKASLVPSVETPVTLVIRAEMDRRDWRVEAYHLAWGGRRITADLLDRGWEAHFEMAEPQSIGFVITPVGARLQDSIRIRLFDVEGRMAPVVIDGVVREE